MKWHFIKFITIYGILHSIFGEKETMKQSTDLLPKCFLAQAAYTLYQSAACILAMPGSDPSHYDLLKGL